MHERTPAHATVRGCVGDHDADGSAADRAGTRIAAALEVGGDPGEELRERDTLVVGLCFPLRLRSKRTRRRKVGHSPPSFA
jgi:hypothetical protein